MTLEIVRYTTRSSHGDGSRPDVNLSNSGLSGTDNTQRGSGSFFHEGERSSPQFRLH